MSIKYLIKRFINIVFAKRPVYITAKTVQLGPTDLLKGRIAVVTGGSSGIGFAIADAFLRAGVDKIVIIGRSETKLNDSIDKLYKKDISRKDRIIYEVMDMCDVSSFDKHFENIKQKVNGKISILVNNAGVLGGTFGNAREEDYDKVLDTNLKGVFFFSQIFAHYMKDNKIEGNILNICSSSSLRPASSAYTISKWGLRGLTMGMAKQLAPFGIIVNGLAPGPTATPMLIEDVENCNLSHPDSPVGRYATADEMGNMAVVLTSGIGRMVIGDVVMMTGGAGIITFDDIKYDF